MIRKITAGVDDLGEVFPVFGLAERSGSHPVSSHRRDAEAAEKSGKEIFGALCVSAVRTREGARVGGLSSLDAREWVGPGQDIDPYIQIC